MACKWPSCCKLSFKSTFFYQNTAILSVNFVSILFCSFFYVKCILFQFLTRAKVMHISILTGAQNRSINRRKNSHILFRNVLFWSFVSEMKVTCMPIACFIYYLFILNAFSFSSLVVAYVCTFLSWQEFKMDA